MLPGLKPLELGRLRMSVGYGTHKKGRPLSPIEVGLCLQKARDAGASNKDCAQEIQLDSTGIGRFLRILDLPQEIQYLINWGSGKDFIGFSSAFELAGLERTDEQMFIAKATLSDGLNKTEIRQIVQIRTRSKRPIRECLQEVLDMRTVIEKRYVFIGSLNNRKVEDALAKLTQAERDFILRYGIDHLGLREVSGRLGKQFFTLVGGARFDESMKNIGKNRIEAGLRSHIAEAIGNV